MRRNNELSGMMDVAPTDHDPGKATLFDNVAAPKYDRSGDADQKRKKFWTGLSFDDDRILRTACVFVSYTVMGMTSSLLGSTVVHLERLFDVDTATMSLTFTCHAVGLLIGSILCGLIYDRTNHELTFACATFIEALATMVAPFLGGAGGLPAFIASMCIQAISVAFIDTSSQSYCVGLWTGHRCREPILLAAHACWSLGGAIGPFIIAPFLVKLPSADQTPADILNATVGWTTDDANWSDVGGVRSAINITTFSGETLPSTYGESVTSVYWNLSTAATSMNGSTADADIARVRYAYVLVGALVLVSCLLFVVAYFRGRSRRVRTANKGIYRSPVDVKIVHNGSPIRTERGSESEVVRNTLTSSPSASVKKDRSIYAIFLAFVFAFYHIFLYVEILPVSFLTTFAIKYLQFPVHDAALINSVFFGCHFSGRIIGIPLSTVIRPRTMLLTNVTLTALAYLILLAFVNVWPAVIWPSVAMSGIAMATTFSTTVLWIDDRVPIDGRVASVILIGSSLGGVVGPLFVGRLFEASSPMWFVYIVTGACICHAVLSWAMLFFVRRYDERLRAVALAVSRHGNESDGEHDNEEFRVASPGRSTAAFNGTS